MTTAAPTRVAPAITATGPVALLPPLLLGAGATAVLAGVPEWSLAPVGALFLWGVREAGCHSARRRVGGHAVTLVALTFVLAVSVPSFLPAAVDQLVLVALASAALAAVLVSAPSARRAVRPRRPGPSDVAWLGGAFAAALPLGVAVLPAGSATVPELAAITALVVLAPGLSEVLYRGLFLHAVGDSPRGVALVALAQGLATVPLFGWWGLATGTLLGAALGGVRRAGGWQASLCAHWGLALGLVGPILMAAG